MMGECTNCGARLDAAVLGPNGRLFCDDECRAAFEHAVGAEVVL